MKKKMCLTAAALLCAFAAPAAQAAAIPQTATVPSHFETAWEQLLAQYGITKPGSSSNNNGNNSNNSGNGSNNSGNGSNSTGGTSTGTSSAAQAVLAEVNAARAKNGLSALTLDANMNRAAAVRAAELAQSFSHTRPNGSRGLTALNEAGVSYRTAGENIASGQQTAQAVVSAWMNSSGHRANILSSSFGRMGVGQATIGGRTYWVQLFAD
ncbi:MAG TPA: CAP domain-containing protein [Butyricicoccus pullicaecorum]|nr:CAP domain-containing protein [Butyricicoccus pullicaecorum]